MATQTQGPEPWMSGTHGDVHPVLAAVLYSFEHARLDLSAWTNELSTDDLARSILGLAPLSFQLRHIAGSVDRLIAYARGAQLSEEQLLTLRSEAVTGGSREELLALLDERLEAAATTVRGIAPESLSEMRYIGRKRVPVPLGTILVHIAEHTQRHVGEAIITAKVVTASR